MDSQSSKKLIASFLKDEFEVKTASLYDQDGNLNENITTRARITKQGIINASK